jgi:hypothetical protein
VPTATRAAVSIQITSTSPYALPGSSSDLHCAGFIPIQSSLGSPRRWWIPRPEGLLTDSAFFASCRSPHLWAGAQTHCPAAVAIVPDGADTDVWEKGLPAWPAVNGPGLHPGLSSRHQCLTL